MCFNGAITCSDTALPTYFLKTPGSLLIKRFRCKTKGTCSELLTWDLSAYPVFPHLTTIILSELHPVFPHMPTVCLLVCLLDSLSFWKWLIFGTRDTYFINCGRNISESLAIRLLRITWPLRGEKNHLIWSRDRSPRLADWLIIWLVVWLRIDLQSD